MNGPRSLVPWALGCGALAALLSAGDSPSGGLLPARAAAALPSGPPSFPAPLAIGNPWSPFEPGGFKVYSGREGRHRVTVVEHHLVETRTFAWEGQDVPCRILREAKFVDGACTETSLSYLAQAADGSVYSFGDVTEPCPPPGAPEDGNDEPGDAESRSWVVGVPGPADPPDTVGATAPALFMPASPEPGDSWKPEDLAPYADETATAVRGGLLLRVPAGRFPGCLEILATTTLDPVRETKWFAPGVGVVRSRTRVEGLALQASTLLRR